MNVKAAFLRVIVLAAAALMGCGKVSESGQVAWETVPWETYTSPDGMVSFEHPSNLQLTVRPPREADDPQLALIMESPNQSLGITLVLRLSDEPLPGYCQAMMDTCLDTATRSATERETISAGSAQGLRQEFREGVGRLAQEYIAVALEARPAYVHFTASYDAANKQSLRPICERIVNSVRLNSP
jgi:hypothetical protein